MRGRSPEEVVQIMTENVRDAEKALEEGTKKKEELAFKAEKSKLRCEMLQTRLLDKKIKRGRIAAQAAEEKRKASAKHAKAVARVLRPLKSCFP